jgi:hypothetical protein
MRSMAVEVRVIPIHTPFVYVVAEIVNAKTVRLEKTHHLWPFIPPTSAIDFKSARIFVAPGIKLPFYACSNCSLPFRLARQAKPESCLEREPVAIGHSLKPVQREHGLTRIRKTFLRMGEGHFAPRILHEPKVLCIRNGKGSQSKFINPNLVNRLLVIPPQLTTHLKLPCRDMHQLGGNRGDGLGACELVLWRTVQDYRLPTPVSIGNNIELNARLGYDKDRPVTECSS